MRTKQEIADVIRSLEIIDTTYKRLESFCDALTERGDHSKITDFGLVVGYGDAFSYKRSGIVVVGKSEVGKSLLAEKFNEKELSDVLAQNELLIFDPDNNGQPEVYRDLFMEPLNLIHFTGEEIIDAYASHLANNRGVPLRVVLHLTNHFQRGFVQPDIGTILSYLSGDYGTLYAPEKNVIPEILQNVTFLEYAKGYMSQGYPAIHILERVFRDVRTRLDDVLSTTVPFK